MNNKNLIKQIISLAICVGLIVPLWGTFHTLIGIKAAWPAFASAALFFAAGHKLKESINVAIGHILGVGWGIAMLTLVSRPEFAKYDGRLISFCVLCLLGVLAVLVTHMGVKLFSHLPSLFCGWAITVGVLGGVKVDSWGNAPVDMMFSILAGIFIIGVGISQLQGLLMKLFKAEDDTEEDTKEVKSNVKKEKNTADEKNVQVISLTEAKMNRYISSYKSTKNISSDLEKESGELAQLKNEIINLRNSFRNISSGISSGTDINNVHVKIVGVCGSPHKKGSTINYVQRALEAAESVGNVTTVLIELAGKDIKPCMGCKTDKCYEKCKINDAMQEFYPILEECDGIIFGSPSYFGTFSGQLKLFMDRLRVMRHTDFQLANKVFAPLSVAGRRHGGQEITNLDLVQTMMRHNAIIVNDGTTVCQLGATGWSHAFDDPGSKADDDEYGMQTAEGVGKRVAEIAKVIKASGLQRTNYKYNAKIGKR